MKHGQYTWRWGMLLELYVCTSSSLNIAPSAERWTVEELSASLLWEPGMDWQFSANGDCGGKAWRCGLGVGSFPAAQPRALGWAVPVISPNSWLFLSSSPEHLIVLFTDVTHFKIWIDWISLDSNLAKIYWASGACSILHSQSYMLFRPSLAKGPIWLIWGP